MWFYFEVPHSVLGAFRKRLQYITLLEALPVLAAVTVWGGILAEQPFLYYGDNEGSKHCFTKGCSRNADFNLLVGIFWLRAAAEGFVPWFGRVSSKDNPVDALSRRDDEDARRRGWTLIFPCLDKLWRVLERWLHEHKIPFMSLLQEWLH